MQIIKRAWSDTWRSLGGWTVIYFVIAVPLVGFGLHYIIAGTGPMNAELQIWLIYGLAATGLVSVGLFGWNLLCTPFRMERDAHLRTIAERDQLLKQVAPPGRLLTQQQQQLLAGTLRESGVKPKRINVVHFSSEECTDFAASIGDAIMSADIQCDVHDGGFYTKNPKDRGIKLYRSKNRSLESLASKIVAQLGEFGFPVELRRTDDEDNIFFYVARSD